MILSLIIFVVVVISLSLFLEKRQHKTQVSQIVKKIENKLSVNINKLRAEKQQLEKDIDAQKNQLNKAKYAEMGQNIKQRELELEKYFDQKKHDLEKDYALFKKNNEAEISARKSDALEEIEQWVKAESIRLTEKLEAEYNTQFEAIQKEMKNK